LFCGVADINSGTGVTADIDDAVVAHGNGFGPGHGRIDRVYPAVPKHEVGWIGTLRCLHAPGKADDYRHQAHNKSHASLLSGGN